ncbi:MAG: chloride channel protein [Archangium sp.]|nr:chloride channel protein [Archangium sp.]
MNDQIRVVWQRARADASRARERASALLRKHLPAESQHLFALTIAVGVVCGFVAVAFHLGIQAAESFLIERALTAPGGSWMAWTIVTPTLGGLLAGVLLTYVVPGARGSGIPQVKKAFALEGGRVRFRDAFGKFWLSILQIGSGASLGREGPTVQICAGATSLLARATSLPAKNMRRLLPVGVAAGIAAAFNAPIAAVTFTIEEIVGSLDHAVLSGVVVAAALAAVIERGVLGVHPVIAVQQVYGLDHPSSLFSYALLGVAGGLVSVAFTDSLLKLRLGFRKSTRLPVWAQPAVGGLVTGVLAVVVLRFLGTTGVTGGGYETLGKALAGQLGLKALLALCLVKMVATAFSYSSGGAGGIFAPSLFIGAMLGGAVGYLDVAMFQHEERQLGAFALVGMGAVFAGVVRAPITSVLIIFEMTGGYGLVLPLMLANMTSYVLARRLRPVPIYEALLEQDGVVLPHATPRLHALEQLTVREAMTSEVVSVNAHDTAEQARAALAGRSFELVPVIQASGAIVGAVSLFALRQAPPTALMSALMHEAQTIFADLPLSRAVVRMNDAGARQLLVLDESTGSRLVGMLSLTDLVRAHARAAGTVQSPRAVGLSGLSELRATDLATSSPVVSGSTPLDELVSSLGASPSGAVVVSARDGKTTGVVLLEHVREFLGDEQLQRMLVAEDLMRPLPAVAEDATLAEVIASCVEQDAPALWVRTTTLGAQPQLITRSALGRVLLDWYAREARA